MTVVTSRLLTPTGAPVRQARVLAQLRASASWLADASGRVVASATALTSDAGAWELDLTPTGDYELADAYYEITEYAGATTATHTCVIPASGPVQLRDVLVTPPSAAEFAPISELDDLLDVSVASAASGESLVFDGSLWVPGAGGGGGTSDHGGLVGLADNDHPQYQLTTEKGVVSGYAELDAGGGVPVAQLPVGTTTGTVAAGDDARLSDARTPLAHAASHGSGGSDAVSPASIGAADAGHSHSPAIFVGPEGSAPDPAVYDVWVVEQ